jgi:hypothetical protein
LFGTSARGTTATTQSGLRKPTEADAETTEPVAEAADEGAAVVASGCRLFAYRPNLRGSSRLRPKSRLCDPVAAALKSLPTLPPTDGFAVLPGTVADAT